MKKKVKPLRAVKANSKAVDKTLKPKPIKKHQQELSTLQQTDPEFFEYLQKNDSGLLSFAADESESDIEEDEVEDEEQEMNEELNAASSRTQKSRKDKAKVEITDDLLATTEKNALSGSLNALKNLIAMLKTACNPKDDIEDDAEEEPDAPNSRFSIGSPEIYEKVIYKALDVSHQCFTSHLQLKDAKGLEEMGQHPRWKKLQMMVISLFKSIMHTISGLVDNMKHKAVSIFLIDGLQHYIPFLAPLPRMCAKVVKTLLNVWAATGPQPDQSSANPTQDFEVQGHAFLRVRQIALVLPGSAGVECFRSIYLRYARHCKSFTEVSAPVVVFMSQCVAELYGTDLSIAYQQAFLYIRQLCLHLRAAVLKKGAEEMRQVSSMQYLNCLRVWTRVVCCFPRREKGLFTLAFPLAQLMLGLFATFSSPYYIPYRLQLVNFLQQIAAHCQVFIPTAALLLEIVENPQLLTKPTPSTEVPPKFQYLVRLPTDSLGREAVRSAIIQEALSLLRREGEIYRYHVGLPEYLHLPIRRLKLAAKKFKSTRWRDVVRTVVGQLEQYTVAVLQHRKTLTTPPMAIVDFEPLKPMWAPGSSQRLAKLLQEGKAGMAVTIDVPSLKSTAVQPAKGFLAASTRKSGSDSEEEEEEEKELEVVKEKKGVTKTTTVKAGKKEKAGKSNKVEAIDSDEVLQDTVTYLDWND